MTGFAGTRVGPGPPSARLLRTAASRERPRDSVSRTQQGRHTLETVDRRNAQSAQPRRAQGGCPRGAPVCPSGPPQVSKEAQRLLWTLLLPSPGGVPTWPSRARPSLRLVPSRTTLSSQALCRTSRPRRERNDHSQLHYIFHHSRHLPCSSPSGREARSPNAQARGPNGGPSFLVPLRRRRPSARALESERRRTGLEPARGAEEPDAQAQRTRRTRAPRRPLRPRLLHLEELEEGRRLWPRQKGENVVGENWQARRWARWAPSVLLPR